MIRLGAVLWIAAFLAVGFYLRDRLERRADRQVIALLHSGALIEPIADELSCQWLVDRRGPPASVAECMAEHGWERSATGGWREADPDVNELREQR